MKFKTIVVDPPWKLSTSMNYLKWVSPLESKYGLMTDEEIANMGVKSLADENCMLFLWTTQNKLPVAFDILKAWEFSYHITITWRKNSGFVQYGFQRRSEFCLVGWRGNINNCMDRYGKSFPTTIDETADPLPFPDYIGDKFKGHSVKPDLFYHHVLRKTYEPRLEMFSRNKRKGFLHWGNEVECDIEFKIAPNR